MKEKILAGIISIGITLSCSLLFKNPIMAFMNFAATKLASFYESLPEFVFLLNIIVNSILFCCFCLFLENKFIITKNSN